MDDIIYAARQVPPFTRTTILGLVLTTLPTLLHLISPYSYVFIPHRIAKNWEFQRLVLPFLFGGSGLPVVFNTIMLFRSLKELEVSHFGERLADMSWAFILICGGIIGFNTPLQTPILFNPFLMAVVHLWGQTNRTGRVSLYGFLTIPAPYFSLALLGMDLLQGGPPAVLVSLTGIAASHAYYYASVVLPQSNPRRNALVSSILLPPQFLINWLGNGPSVPPSGGVGTSGGQTLGGGGGGGRSMGFGTAFRPANPIGGGGQRLGGGSGTSTGSSTSSGTAVGGDRQASHRWGRGNRLGGEGL